MLRWKQYLESIMADERMQGGGEGGAGQPGPQCYLLVHNVSKKHNIGTLARSAVAFNVRQICLVGSKKYNMFGNHGSGDYMSLKHAEDLRSAREYLKGECGCQILGVEIVEGAKPIQDHPFVGNTAFILGNEVGGREQRGRWRPCRDPRRRRRPDNSRRHTPADPRDMGSRRNRWTSATASFTFPSTGAARPP